MAAPVYGRQYIRFAETGLVPDAAAIPQFRVVQATGTTDPTSVTNVFSAAGEALGVIQQEKNLASTGLATDLMREATIATSGLLLVEHDAANPLAVGDVLTVDVAGKASVTGVSGTNHFAVTVNATTPIVRQLVGIGGQDMVLVSFN